MTLAGRPRRDTLSRLAFAGTLLVTALACGGAPAAGTPAAPTQAPAPTQVAPGPGELANFCLNTPAEVAAAFGVPEPSLTSTPNPGFGGGCLYQDANGRLVYSIGIVPVVAGSDLIAAGLQTPGSVAISGVGEAAVLVSDQGPLVYRKGPWIVSTVGVPTLAIASDAARYRAALESLARASSARL